MTSCRKFLFKGKQLDLQNCSMIFNYAFSSRDEYAMLPIIMPDASVGPDGQVYDQVSYII